MPASSACEMPNTRLRRSRIGLMSPDIFENEFIRQGILSENEYPLPVRSFAMEPIEIAKILADILTTTGWTQSELARKVHVGQGTISKWRSTTQVPNMAQWRHVEALIRRDGRLRHLISPDVPVTSVPVFGKVGAGSIVEPEYDQVPPEGLSTIELPFPVPAEMIAFLVEGDSMLPRYDEGDAIICWREQRRGDDTFIGEEAAVRTADGRRYIKILLKGTKAGTFALQSFNAKLIEGVKIEWIGEIYITIRAGQLARLHTAKKSSRAKREKTRSIETAGMTELPLRGAR